MSCSTQKNAEFIDVLPYFYFYHANRSDGTIRASFVRFDSIRCSTGCVMFIDVLRCQSLRDHEDHVLQLSPQVPQTKNGENET